MFAVEPQDQVPQFMDALRVQPFGGFVEQDQVGLRQERLRQREPLAHPVAVHAHGIVDAFFQADEADRLLDLGIREAARVAREDPQVASSR